MGGPCQQGPWALHLELRDELAWCLEVGDDQVAMDAVSDLDARFEVVTTEDGRFARHFAAQAGIGWWWQRMPADPEAQRYITQDWR